MKKLIPLLAICLLFTACDNELSYVQTGATIATGSYLSFAIKDSAVRETRASQIWAASKAAYSLASGHVPTVKEFQDTFISFGGTAPDLGYLNFVQGLSDSYKALYDKLVASKNPKAVVQVFMDIAKGCEVAAEAYVTPPTPSS